MALAVAGLALPVDRRCVAALHSKRPPRRIPGRPHRSRPILAARHQPSLAARHQHSQAPPWAERWNDEPGPWKASCRNVEQPPPRSPQRGACLAWAQRRPRGRCARVGAAMAPAARPTRRPLAPAPPDPWTRRRRAKQDWRIPWMGERWGHSGHSAWRASGCTRASPAQQVRHLQGVLALQLEEVPDGDLEDVGVVHLEVGHLDGGGRVSAVLEHQAPIG
jgi:hypothetical protein